MHRALHSILFTLRTFRMVAFRELRYYLRFSFSESPQRRRFQYRGWHTSRTIATMYLYNLLMKLWQSFSEFALRMVARWAAHFFWNLRISFSRFVALIFGSKSEAVCWHRFCMRSARQYVKCHTMRWATLKRGSLCELVSGSIFDAQKLIFGMLIELVAAIISSRANASES